MAKYNLDSRGDSVVNCDILNESDGRYIVRFGNGIIKAVNKNKVHSLNGIDEGVLDMVNESFGDNLRKYGQKVVSKVREVGRKVIDFIIRPFKIGKFVFFKNDDTGEVYSASHPINAMIAAETNRAINFYGSDSIKKVADEVGIEMRDIENFQYEGEYEGAFQPGEELFEGVRSRKSNSLLEMEGDIIGGSGHKINLEAPALTGVTDNNKANLMFDDVDMDTIVRHLCREFDDRHKYGNKCKMLPTLIWGAPGIGKTQIIQGIAKILEDKYKQHIPMIAINCRAVGPDSFHFPSNVQDNEAIERRKAEFKKKHKEEEYDIMAEIRKIKMLPMDWMPVYNSEEKDEEIREKQRKMANGGDGIDDGPGGIIFLDEYCRMTEDAGDSLLSLPSTRYFSSKGETLGDRWLIVGASNRKSDLGKRSDRSFSNTDAAGNTRWALWNYLPTFDEWKKWASSKSEIEGRDNIHPKILKYIEYSMTQGLKVGEKQGDFYNMTNVATGEQNVAEPRACPRTWESFSYQLYLLIEDFGDIYKIPYKSLMLYGTKEVGRPVAQRFCDYLNNTSFTEEDANSVWRTGRSLRDKDFKKAINSDNFKQIFEQSIFPKLEKTYPNKTNQQGISQDNLINVITFINNMAPKVSGAGEKLDANVLKELFIMLGDMCQPKVDLVSFENDGSESLYADAQNMVYNILSSNDYA